MPFINFGGFSYMLLLMLWPVLCGLFVCWLVYTLLKILARMSDSLASISRSFERIASANERSGPPREHA